MKRLVLLITFHPDSALFHGIKGVKSALFHEITPLSFTFAESHYKKT